MIGRPSIRIARSWIPILAVLLGSAGGLLLVAAVGGSARALPPNLILVVLDSLRYDHLGCYGYPRGTTPCIDRLARQGTLFTRVTAQAPWTCPSVVSLLTSLYPAAHGLTHTTGERAVLREGVPTAAEILGSADYHTQAFIQHAWLTPEAGYAQGFEEYHQIDPGPPERLAEVLLDRMREGIREPFFSYVHFFDPHLPYRPAPPLDRCFGQDGFEVHHPVDSPDFHGPPVYIEDRDAEGRAILDTEHYRVRYDGEIRSVDRQLARVLATLGREGLMERTALVVTSDHGDGFLDHGLWSHGYALYDELVKLPLVMVLPESGGNTPIVTDLTESIDVLPTLLELAGIEVPAHLQGRSRLPMLRDADRRGGGLLAGWLDRIRGREEPEVPVDRFGFAHCSQDHGWTMVRNGRYKYTRNSVNGLEELYDLDRDPAERRNLLDTPRGRELRTELLPHLESWMQTCLELDREFGARDRNLEPDARQEEQLRSLGYLD